MNKLKLILSTLLLALAFNIGAMDKRKLNKYSTLNKHLLKAVHAGDTKKVDRLIKAKTNVNITDKDKCTPLHIAAYNGKKEIVKLLIAAGAYVNATNNEGETPLHYAILNIGKLKDHKEIAQMLIAAGAHANKANKEGETPLHIACYASETTIVEILLNAYADINVTNNYGETPFRIKEVIQTLTNTYILKKLATSEGPPVFAHKKSTKIASNGKKETLI